MKKCPTCGKEFDDNMRFCQVDGTPLGDDTAAVEEAAAPAAEEPAFDPYATIVGVPREATADPSTPSSGGEQILEPIGDAAETATAGSIPVAEPEDVLEVPGVDPLKTMYVSDAEMKEVLGKSASADTPVEEIKADEAEVSAPSEPEPPSFGDMSPPPSPFSEPPSSPEDIPMPVPPSFLEPEPIPASEAETQVQQESPFQEAPTVYQSAPEPPPFAAAPEPAPIQQQEWAPPPAPTPEWQNQQIGSNTPFQPPPAGTAGGDNKTLAIISLVLGVVSLCCYIGWLTGPAALVTGFLALRNINRDPASYGGKGLAIAGMIVGGLFTVLWVIYWVAIILVYAGILGASMIPGR